jgi:hypothetical protein
MYLYLAVLAALVLGLVSAPWALALIALVAVTSPGSEGFETLLYPGQPAYFFDTDARGNPVHLRDGERA